MPETIEEQLAALTAELRALKTRHELTETAIMQIKTDRKWENARRPLRHGEGSHAGYIGAERNIIFDINSGHDHDGADSKQIDHGSLSGLADDDHVQYLNLTKTGQTLTENLSVSSGKTLDGIDLGELRVLSTAPHKILAADGVTVKNLYIVEKTWQTPSADGDRFIMHIIAGGNETTLALGMYGEPDSGRFDLIVNGLLDSSGYDNYASPASNIMRTITLTQVIGKGINIIELRVNGKNASSTNYYLNVWRMAIF